jgi:hypothetical protein
MIVIGVAALFLRSLHELDRSAPADAQPEPG